MIYIRRQDMAKKTTIRWPAAHRDANLDRPDTSLTSITTSSRRIKDEEGGRCRKAFKTVESRRERFEGTHRLLQVEGRNRDQKIISLQLKKHAKETIRKENGNKTRGKRSRRCCPFCGDRPGEEPKENQHPS